MFVTLSATALSLCMHCESYVPVVCAILPSKPSIDQSSTPSYYTHPVLGGASPMQQINTELTVSSVVASAAVTALPTFPRLKNTRPVGKDGCVKGCVEQKPQDHRSDTCQHQQESQQEPKLEEQK